MNRKSILIWAMAIGTLSSCMENELYNAEAAREKAEKAFGMTIDPNQDWNMIETVKANISIKEDALSNYKFKIYTANPLSAESSAALLAEKAVSTDAKGKADAELTFDMPSYMEYVYVARVDDHGRRLVKSAKVDNGTLTMGFGTSTATTRAMVEGNLPTMVCPYTHEEVENLIKEGYDISLGQEGPNGYGGEATYTSVTEIERLTYKHNMKTTHTWVIKDKDFGGTLNCGIDVQNSMYSTFDKIGYNWNKTESWPTFKSVSISAPRDFKVVVSNARWTINQASSRIGDVDVIVAPGGVLEIASPLEMANTSRIVVMPQKVMPDGTVIPSGKIISTVSGGNQYSSYCINNNSSKAVIYNAGEINVKWINQNNGTIYNAPDAIIKLIGLNFSNDGEVVTNWGKIDVNKIVGNGNGEHGTINNGCLLRSKEEINVKYLNQGANTAIECDKISFWELSMRENSILRATNLSMNHTDIRYVGAEGGDALISAQNIEKLNNESFKITDHIYFEANTYNDNGASTDPEQSKYTGSYMRVILDAMDACNGKGLAKVGEANITISGSNTDDLSQAGCTGKGNTPTDRVEETDTSGYFTYAFEDQNKDGGDYDMNDVVLYCSAPKDGKITVRLAAAGASKNLTVHFKNEQENTDVALFNGSEIHDLFKVEKKELVNTGSGPNCAEISAEIEVGEGFSYQNHGDFYIKDEQGRESHTPAFDTRLNERGNVPYGICVPKEWKYPKERCGIQYAYPNFETWAGNMTSNKDWYETGVSGNIYEKKAE